MDIPKWLQPKEEPLRLTYDEYVEDAIHSDQDVEFLVRLANTPAERRVGAFTIWNWSNMPAFQRNKMGR